MPITTVRTPSGEEVKVEHPEGASDAEIIAYAQQNYQAPERGFGDAIDDFSTMDMLKNAPRSLLGQVDDVVDAVAHPVDTATNLFGAASGALGKIPGIEATPENTAKADAVGNFYKDRYSSWDNFMSELQDDPFSVLGDASTALTGGAMAIPKVGGKIAKAGAAIDPINIAKNAAIAPIRAIGTGQRPTRMQQHAFNLDDPEVAGFVLEKGYVPNDEGFKTFTEDFNEAKGKLQQSYQSNPQVNALNQNNQMLDQAMLAMESKGVLTPEKRAAFELQKAGNLKKRAAIQANDPNIQRHKTEFEPYGKLMDKFVSARGRAQKGAGGITPDLALPLGAGMAGGALLGPVIGMDPSLTMAAAVGISGLYGIASQPANVSKLGHKLYNMPTPMAGFAENRLLTTMTQQAIREIGNTEMSEQISTGGGF